VNQQVMQERILDYLPEKVNRITIIQKFHRILVFNFWHFNFVYLLYVLRTYFYVGHIPQWKYPIYSDLPDTFLWGIHYAWVFLTILIAHCSVWIWIGLHVFSLSKKISISYFQEWAWIVFGLFGIFLYKWLKYESSFGFHNWFFD